MGREGERSAARESEKWEGACGRGGAEPAETHPETSSSCRATCLGRLCRPSLVAGESAPRARARAPDLSLSLCCYCLSLSLCLLLCLCHILSVSVYLLPLLSVFLPSPTSSISLSQGLFVSMSPSPHPPSLVFLSLCVPPSLLIFVPCLPRSFLLSHLEADLLAPCLTVFLLLNFLSISAPMSIRPCFCQGSEFLSVLCGVRISDSKRRSSGSCPVQCLILFEPLHSSWIQGPSYLFSID